MSGQALNIQIPLPDDFAALVGQIQIAAAAIKQDLAEIKTLRETPLSYSEKEAADLLGISELTLQRLRRDNKIRFSRVGTKARYLPEQITAYLKSNEIGGARK